MTSQQRPIPDIMDDLIEALKARRRSVLTRGGGISRRVAADPTADALIIEATAALDFIVKQRRRPDRQWQVPSMIERPI